jgi:hypothetical protein
MNIYEKLQQARIDLEHRGIKKTGHNKFSNYKYYELDDFIVPVMNIFQELKLCPIVSYNSERGAKLTLVNIENPEEIIIIESSPANCTLKGMHDIQNLGAVETYHRRYLYITLLEITENDIIDGDEKTIPEKKEKITPELLQELLKSGTGEQIRKAKNEFIIDKDSKVNLDARLTKLKMDYEAKKLLKEKPKEKPNEKLNDSQMKTALALKDIVKIQELIDKCDLNDIQKKSLETRIEELKKPKPTVDDFPI